MDDENDRRAAPVDPRVQRTREDVLSTALHVLVEQGWDAVTHQHVAREAGYAKATLYKHWPTRPALIADAFTRLGDVPHHEPTGDLRVDLIAELTSFRTAMEEAHLDRALCALANLGNHEEEISEVRRTLVADGEQVLRGLLRQHLDGPELEAATLMLAGAVLYRAMMHGTPPSDAVLAAAVDAVLRSMHR